MNQIPATTARCHLWRGRDCCLALKGALHLNRELENWETRSHLLRYLYAYI